MNGTSEEQVRQQSLADRMYQKRGRDLSAAMREVLQTDGVYRLIYTLRCVAIGTLRSGSVSDPDDRGRLRDLLCDTDDMFYWPSEAELKEDR